jgi:biopolymer transport protein ExbB/TolQ
MAATLFPTIFLASGGIVFAFENSTLPGRLILLSLFFASIFSWAVMVTKFRVIRHATRRREQFLTDFRSDRHPLRIYTERGRFEGAPVFAVYKAGCRELTFQLLGSAEVDETFRARLDIAQKISPAQMRVVTTSMERAVGETALRLESQMILLATAVSGAPFLGLLGTVWGVMETFGDVAAAGSANLAAMAPGVSAALITTVTGLLVAIPAMFGYNYLVTTIRAMIVGLDNFAAELASEFEHKYVDHGERGRAWK